MVYLALALIGIAPWVTTMIALLKNYKTGPGPFCVSMIISLICAMCIVGVYTD